MYKVLHIMNGADAGGISTFVKNYYARADKEKVHFDFAITDEKIGPNGLALQAMGSDFYYLPVGIKAKLQYVRKIVGILKENGYDCIHVHLNESSYWALIAGKVAKVPVRIAHAHGVSKSDNLFAIIRLMLSRVLNPLFATKLLACSEEAGISIFGKNGFEHRGGTILYNAIDFKLFEFDYGKREVMRDKLALRDKFVVGNVGNLTSVKNQGSVIDIFKVVHNSEPNSALIIVGEGELRGDLEQRTVELELEDAVIFTGSVSNTNDYYQAFDVFLFPSYSEGFGMAELEALASGLICITSPTVPAASCLPDNVVICELSASTEDWAKDILNVKNRMIDRKESISKIDPKYNIEYSASELEKMYEECTS